VGSRSAIDKLAPLVEQVSGEMLPQNVTETILQKGDVPKQANP
jgi:hypothetical protein